MIERLSRHIGTADLGADLAYRTAPASEKPLESLRRIVARELEAGVPRERLIAQLEDLRADLRASGRVKQ